MYTTRVQHFSPVDKYSCRRIFVFTQETIGLLSNSRPEKCVKLFLDAALTADRFAMNVVVSDAKSDYSSISFDFLQQAVSLYDGNIREGKTQYRSVVELAGTLLSLRSIGDEGYESLITKVAQFAAKIPSKPDQCHLVALCAHLFYPSGNADGTRYRNAQRCLECLQRCLKLADACTSMNPEYIHLFVDLLEHYLFFFEKRNPLITHAYLTGLVALIKEHLGSPSTIGGNRETKAHFLEVVRFVKEKKANEETAEWFSQIQV